VIFQYVVHSTNEVFDVNAAQVRRAESWVRVDAAARITEFVACKNGIRDIELAARSERKRISN
jgi:hypothetical protein